MLSVECWTFAEHITKCIDVLRAAFSSHPSPNGKIAQLVEQRTENPCVPGSIPGLATIFSRCEKMSRRSPELVEGAKAD